MFPAPVPGSQGSATHFHPPLTVPWSTQPHQTAPNSPCKPYSIPTSWEADCSSVTVFAISYGIAHVPKSNTWVSLSHVVRNNFKRKGFSCGGHKVFRNFSKEPVGVALSAGRTPSSYMQTLSG